GVLPRFVSLPADLGAAGPKNVFIPLEAVIRMHLPDLFPGMKLDRDAVFRVTRDSDIEIDDHEVGDLRKAIEQAVGKRRRGVAVRLQIELGGPVELEWFLMNKLDLDQSDVFRCPGLLDLGGLFPIASLNGYPHLRDPQFTPQPIYAVADAPSIWAAIRARDV